MMNSGTLYAFHITESQPVQQGPVSKTNVPLKQLSVMVKNTETGHAKIVANFEDLISFCKAYGEKYKPSNPALELSALGQQVAALAQPVQAVKVAKAAYDNATNAREIAFKPLRPRATQSINALAATQAARQTVDDARTIVNKIQGRRAKAVNVPDAAAIAAGATPVKTASVAQTGFDNMIDHFARLITLLTAEPKYLPNEEALQLPSLNALLADLKAKNASVIEVTPALSNARIARDKLLYAENTGVVDTALSVKLYVKSLFGASSPEYKQISGLKFIRRSVN
jgi:hypothetical protein